MISCSTYDCHFEQALCDLGASVNIMPKATFEKLSYPALSPTIRYPEGIVHNLLVEVKETFIVADFVVLDMEGNLGIVAQSTTEAEYVAAASCCSQLL